MQQKHTSEHAAVEAARKLGNQFVYIVESRGSFYVEDDCGMIRAYESITYQGKGCKAKVRRHAPVTEAQHHEVNRRVLGNFFASL